MHIGYWVYPNILWKDPFGIGIPFRVVDYLNMVVFPQPSMHHLLLPCSSQDDDNIYKKKSD